MNNVIDSFNYIFATVILIFSFFGLLYFGFFELFIDKALWYINKLQMYIKNLEEKKECDCDDCR